MDLEVVPQTVEDLKLCLGARGFEACGQIGALAREELVAPCLD